MDKLTAAIREQYQRRLTAIQQRDNDIIKLDSSGLQAGFDNDDMYLMLRDAIYGYYQPRIDDAARIIQVLEGVRDVK